LELVKFKIWKYDNNIGSSFIITKSRKAQL